MSLQPYYSDSSAIVIGINKYRHVNQLAFACSDAKAVTEILISELGFAPGSVITLLDDDATRAEIMKRFCALETLPDDSRIFVFFAGHGTTAQGQRGDVGYLIPVDGNIEDKSTLIPWHELTKAAELFPAKHVLFVMDACYSGLAIQRGSAAGGKRFISAMLQRISRQVIAAGKSDETVADSGSQSGKNSIFTGHLLEGLHGKAANSSGVLTGMHLMNYVYDKVANDPQSTQTPHYGYLHGGGDIILRTPDNGHLSVGSKEDFLVDVPPAKPEPVSAEALIEIKPEFAEKSGYRDLEAEDFGQNEWSKKLGKVTWSGNSPSVARPTHWLAFVIEPVSNKPVELHVGKLVQAVRNNEFKDDDLKGFSMPSQAMTTLKSAIFYDVEHDGKGENNMWKRFIRIQNTGAIEYCDCVSASSTHYLGANHERKGSPEKVFHYIQTIGLVWHFIFAAKALLRYAKYDAGVRYLVNLVGAKDTSLVQFATGIGKDGQAWRQPFSPDGFGEILSGGGWRCHDPNFQSIFQASLNSFDVYQAKKLIDECADQLGLAYNHQSTPRCYNYGTDIFPWKEFDINRHLI